MTFLAFQRVLGGVANKSSGVAHFIHYAIAGIDTGGAGNAFVLQPVADIDAGRADLDTQLAVDTVTQARFSDLGMAERFLAVAAGFAAGVVVRNDQRIAIEHHRLEASIGAHVNAHLLTQPAGVEVGKN